MDIDCKIKVKFDLGDWDNFTEYCVELGLGREELLQFVLVEYIKNLSNPYKKGEII